MKIAKANSGLRGKQPKLKPNQAKRLLELHDLVTYTQAELAELFGVGRSTIYRTLERMRPRPPGTRATLRTPCESADDGTAPDIIPIKQSKGLARGVRGRLAPPCASVDDRPTGMTCRPGGCVGLLSGEGVLQESRRVVGKNDLGLDEPRERPRLGGERVGVGHHYGEATPAIDSGP